MTQLPPLQNDWRKHLAPGNGSVVEAAFEALRARHALALHCFEGKEAEALYPEKTLGQLRANSPFFIAGKPVIPGKDDPSLFSMTLLPSPVSEKSTFTYNKSPLGNQLGYLFDLSSGGDTAARTVRVFTRNGDTNFGAKNKELHLDRETRITELDALYASHMHTAPGQESAALSDRRFIQSIFLDPALSGRQLTALGKSYEDGKGQDIVPMNELVVAASARHIAAIAVPVYKSASHTETLLQPMRQLSGALAGLEHARNGMHPPVVYYHIEPPQHGQVTYLAQGREQCEAAAKEAIARLQQLPGFGKAAFRNCFPPGMPTLRENVKRVIGIDLYAPLQQRGGPA